MSDAQVVADHLELAARWMTAWLCIPMLSDEFWEQWSAGLVAEIDEELTLCSNACAVMTDVTQPLALNAEES